MRAASSLIWLLMAAHLLVIASKPSKKMDRSILADPRDPDMKRKVNATIKYREDFRPFAPSIQIEAIEEYFGSFGERIPSEILGQIERIKREITESQRAA